MSQSNVEEASEAGITGEIITALFSDDVQQQLFATRKFKSLLSKKVCHPSVGEDLQTGIVPRLVEFLKHNENSTLQFQAAWALTNIAFNSSQQTKNIIKAEAVPVLIQLLDSENNDVQEQAVWALGNIAGDSPENRDYVLEHGILMPLLQLLCKEKRISMTSNAVWTLSNLCRGKNPPPKFEQISPSLPALSRLLSHTDADVLSNACWAISYISDGPKENIQAVIDAEVCRRLVELLMHSSESVVSPASKAVGNIATGDNIQTQVLLNCNALPHLLHLLSSPIDNIKRNACWTISNITAGNRQQIQAVLDQNIIQRVMEILKEAEGETRKEASWVLANASAGGSPEQLRYLIDQQCIPHLCEQLTMLDANIMPTALKGLENILKLGEQETKARGTVNPYAVMIEKYYGMDKIEFLQSCENMENLLWLGRNKHSPSTAPLLYQKRQFQFRAPNQKMPKGGYSF